MNELTPLLLPPGCLFACAKSLPFFRPPPAGFIYWEDFRPSGENHPGDRRKCINLRQTQSIPSRLSALPLHPRQGYGSTVAFEKATQNFANTAGMRPPRRDTSNIRRFSTIWRKSSWSKACGIIPQHEQEHPPPLHRSSGKKAKHPILFQLKANQTPSCSCTGAWRRSAHFPAGTKTD